MSAPPAAAARYAGARTPRVEDPRPLTGHGTFVDDVVRPGMVHAHFVRSPLARARILGVDAAEALALPGVHAVFTADDLADVFVRAAHVARETFHQQSSAAVLMETRGLVAEWSPSSGEMTIWASTQTPHETRLFCSRRLRLDEHRIRVVMRDTGGGFGQKAVPQREDMCVMLAARKVPGPLKWIEDRQENLIAAGQGRHEHGDARIAYDEDGNPLTTTFMDYLLPTTTEVPTIEYGHLESPGPGAGGDKGVGEGGAIGSPPAVANAVADALAPLGVKITRLPLFPASIVESLDAAARAARP
ncbi:molybdopterin cofactor-binding domain-containing protein [Actinomadura nitritigenes]|uniref:molybdopterin cofactor-binding domain-containing protein n=1 Tax=Actinomadura nitritigenes TaxID=134602 RepID=UPI003D9051F3